MSDLILLMSAQRGGAWDWALTDRGEWGHPESDEDKSAVSKMPFTRLIAVLPGTEIVTKIHTLEGLNEKQRVQAAGFSIEDELAASLDDTHIAFDANSSRMAICAKSRVRDVIDELAEFGVSPDIICADYNCFSDDANFEYQGRVISQSGSGLGYTMDTNLAEAIRDKDQGKPASITPQALLEKIAKSFMAGHEPINLRQGNFAKRSAIGAKRYTRLAALAATLVLGYLAVNLGQGLYYANKTKAVNDEIATIYADLFPDTEIPANPVIPVIKAQAERKGSTSSDFVTLSALLAKSVEEIDNVEISSLRYDKARGQLNLSIIYGSFEDTEKLKTAVRKNGGVFTEGGTRQSGEGLTGDAVLRGGV